jgi:hypothetical protein
MAKKLMKRRWFFPLMIVLVIGVLLILSKKKFVLLPHDAVHAGLTNNVSCIGCHSEGGESPLSKRHPPKEQCLTCHKRQ